jgi:hypothetical protein
MIGAPSGRSVTTAGGALSNASAAVLPAGSTAAVLSLVDVGSGGVDVVRHWPGAPEDVVVRPFVPYFWDGCPGDGAIMVLLTGPSGAPALGNRAAAALGTAVPRGGPAVDTLARIIATLRTPGSPANEALKAAAPWVSDLQTYERDGYAVFLFVHWTGVRCGVSVEAVPEGYAIPFVR